MLMGVQDALAFTMLFFHLFFFSLPFIFLVSLLLFFLSPAFVFLLSRGKWTSRLYRALVVNTTFYARKRKLTADCWRNRICLVFLSSSLLYLLFHMSSSILDLFFFMCFICTVFEPFKLFRLWDRWNVLGTLSSVDTHKHTLTDTHNKWKHG